MKCRPLSWLLWGLIPILALIGYTLFSEKDNIEADLTGRMQAKLNNAGLDWAKPSFDGRDGTIQGLTLEESKRVTVSSKASGLYGVRILDDKTGLAAAVAPYIWSATTKDKTLDLTGYAPSKEAKSTILAKAKTLYPDYTITDNTKIARGTATENWTEQTDFSLDQLKNLENGTAGLSDNAFSIQGRANTSAHYALVKENVRTKLAPGLTLHKDQILPPVASPYKWSLAHSGDTVTLTGYVPNEATRKALHARIKEHYPNATITDNTQIADGAPDKWLESATLSSKHASTLVDGKATLTDKTANISGSVPDYTAHDKATNSFKTAALDGYTHTASLTSLKPRIPTASPFTWMADNTKETLLLRGYAPSEPAKKEVAEAAQKKFPNKKIQDNMVVANGAPKGWLTAAHQSLTQLSLLDYGTASLKNTDVNLTGFAKSEAVKAKIKPIAKDAGYNSTLNITAPKPKPKPKPVVPVVIPAPVIEAVIPKENITGKDSAQICEKLIGNFLHREKINFQVAKATIADSSFPLLNKLAHIIRKCPDTQIQINGHTDSDGSEAGNEKLSFDRATSVYAYLVDQGIQTDRLKAAGLGESQPLVPNDSPKNKAKNRRIEFKLSTK